MRELLDWAGEARPSCSTAVEVAVSLVTEMGVFERMAVSRVAAAVGDEDIELVGSVGVGATKGAEELQCEGCGG